MFPKSKIINIKEKRTKSYYGWPVLTKLMRRGVLGPQRSAKSAKLAPTLIIANIFLKNKEVSSDLN